MNLSRIFTIRKHHFLLILLFIIIISNIIYIFPKLNDSPVPSKWSVGIDWGRYYILNTGFIYNNNLTTLTWQSNILNYGSVDILPKIFFAIINIITGTIEFPNDLKFHYNFPWVGTLFLPIIVLSFYKFVSKEEDKRLNYFDFCLILLFSMFPLASSLDPVSGNTNGSGIARVLFVFILVLLIEIFKKNKKDYKKVTIFILLLITFFNYYHTWIYYLVIYFVLLILITTYKKEEQYIASILVYGIVLFFGTAMYYNFKLFQEPMTLIKFFPSILKNFPSVLYTAKVNSNYIGYQTFNSTYSYLQAINSMLIIIVCIVFIYVYIKLKKHETYENILFYFLIAQAGIAFGLFIWDGLVGVYSRIFESIVYVTMLLSVYVLVKCNNKMKYIMRSVLLLAIFITIFSYVHPPATSNWQLTSEEFTGIRFAGNEIPNHSYIFSDFRLGTPLIYFNQLGIVTIDSLYNPPDITENILSKCYYEVSKPQSILDEVIHSNSYFVLISSRQAQVNIIDPSLTRFKPAEINFQEKWDNEKAFSKVYSSKYVDIFARNA